MDAALLSPLAIGPVTLPNRIAVPPMCLYSAVSGIAQTFHRVHYGMLAGSGAGLVCIESMAVSPEGRITGSDLGLWSDECEAGLRSVIDAMHAVEPGCRVMVQLNHAGRKASVTRPWEAPQRWVPPMDGGWRPRAPSAVPFSPDYGAPREIGFEDCARIADDFAQAALRAARAGADAVQIHMAHGYLIHQFLSPLSNLRIDEYGGALANRCRFAAAVMDAVKRVLPANAAAGIRVSATDWVPGGWDLEDTVYLARLAKAQGMDFIDVSTGGNHPEAPIPEGPGYQASFARRVREETGLLVFTAGMIRDPWQAETLLRDGAADVINIGRAMLDDPRWGWHAARALGAHSAGGLEVPKSYARGIRL